jgi:hypothetical protein
MKNLKELREFFVFEQVKDTGLARENNKYVVSGVIQRADAKNGNGRIYPKGVLDREIRNYQKLINERRSLGELDHPESRSVIELKNVSHLLTKIWWDGADVYGTFEILNTPSGNILKQLLDEKITLGVSSRGLGTVAERNGYTLVEEDFQLICWDFVSDPSTSGAFMLREANDLKLYEKYFTKSDKINRIMNDILYNG